MGVDLIGIRRSYTWSGWHALYDLGVAFGWRPAGALKPKEPVSHLNSYPPDDDPGPRDGYFSAAAWAAAIYRALDAVKDKSAMTAEQAEAVKEIEAAEEIDLTDPKIEEWVRDFADAISQHGFCIA